jgi:hypothetical protein
MAQYYAPMSLPALYTSQYSILHQERLYLLKALADEEERGERLTKSLETLKSKLEKLDPENPEVSARKIKTAMKSVRNKIGKCQHRERALCQNLTNVVAQMEGMKRYQYRSAYQHYSQQSQHGQMRMMISPAAPNFALQSPLTYGIAAQMQYMTLGSPRQPNVYIPPRSYNTYLAGPAQQLPQTPMLLPAAIDYHFSGLTHNGQMGVHHSHPDNIFESPVSSISPFDLAPFASNSRGATEIDAVSPLSNAPRPLSWPSSARVKADPGQTPLAGEQPVGSHFIRRLSSIDATSVGLKLDRLSRKASHQGAM